MDILCVLCEQFKLSSFCNQVTEKEKNVQDLGAELVNFSYQQNTPILIAGVLFNFPEHIRDQSKNLGEAWKRPQSELGSYESNKGSQGRRVSHYPLPC